jgi:uncharacterized protein (DUF488 family)
MSTVFTVGHGTRALEELMALLQTVPIEILIDVRRFPGSRRHPHFERASLERALPEHHIDYQWWGEKLGGRRSGVPNSRHLAIRNESFRGYTDFMDTVAFRTAIAELEEMAGSVTLAIMCAETLWWRCHRRHIADVLLLDGLEVIHLLDANKTQPHKLHPALRTDDDGRPVYDVGETQKLIE